MSKWNGILYSKWSTFFLNKITIKALRENRNPHILHIKKRMHVTSGTTFKFHWACWGCTKCIFRLDYKSIKSEAKNPSLNPDHRLKPLAWMPQSLQCQSMPWGSVPPYANILWLLSIKIWSFFELSHSLPLQKSFWSVHGPLWSPRVSKDNSLQYPQSSVMCH